MQWQRCSKCERPTSSVVGISCRTPLKIGRGSHGFGLSSSPALHRCGCPRKTGMRALLPRIPSLMPQPQKLRARRKRVSVQGNRAFAARFTAPVPAPTTATALRLTMAAIVPSARAPAARPQMLRWAFCRQTQRGLIVRRSFLHLPRRQLSLAQLRGLRLTPGSPALLLS